MRAFFIERFPPRPSRRERGQPEEGEPGQRQRACRTVNPLSGDSHVRPPLRRTRGDHTPAVSAAGPARQGIGPDPCRDIARAIARAGPRARQPRAAFRHGDRVLRHRRRRRLGVEGRLRGARSRPGIVPAQIRRGDALARGLSRGDAGDADAACRAARLADPPLGGIRALPAILDTDRARLCRRRSGHADSGRFRARTLGRHRLAGDLRRTGESPARA